MPEGRITRATKKPLFLHYACASAHFEENDLESLRMAIFEIVQQLNSTVKERKWVLEVKEEQINHTDFLAMIKHLE